MGKYFTGPKSRRRLTRALALGSAAALTAALIPAAAAEEIGDGVTASCDEAYYATLDYYGNLTEGSVVKSYLLNGTDSITDYGTYDTVNNLTDGTQPATAGGKTTFDFSGSAPEHFCFEGVTSQPFKTLPWTLSLSYTLNGVPVKAEELAGKTGVVEITVNAVPNAAASEYARDNYTLEAMAAFNQNDILSLEAEGAQVQLVGNLRIVLFVALPGEEQHFTIRVGSDDFSFDGMTFLMVPATLSQLSEISKLSQKKDDLEDDYNKLSDSLDTMLDAMNGMSGSLNETASGLDELNRARGTISAGKNDVYADADKVIADLNTLDENLSGIPGHLDSASEAVTAVSDDLNDLSKTVGLLKTQLKTVSGELDTLQDDLDDVKAALNGDSPNLKDHLGILGTNMGTLQRDLATLKTTMDALDVQLGGSTGNDVTVNGVSLTALNAATESADALKTKYAALGSGQPLNFTQFALACVMAGNPSMDLPTASAAVKALLPLLTMDEATATAAGQTANWTLVQQMAGVYQEATGTAAADALAAGNMDFSKFLYAMLRMQGDTAEQANKMVSLYQLSQSDTASGLLNDMSNLCGLLNSSGLSGDLSKLTGLTAEAVTDLSSLTDTSQEILKQCDTLLGQTQSLNDTVQKYVPEMKDTLEEAKSLVSAFSTTLGDTSGFLTSFESLSKKAGEQLDAGTEKTLSGLASTLRKAAESLSSTDDVKSAKDSIDGIIRDTWDEYTGGDNNLLNTDADAPAESLTSASNPAPSSVQVLIRTQEIKVAEPAEEEKSAVTADSGTFWSRLMAMFRGIGSDIAGVFQH